MKDSILLPYSNDTVYSTVCSIYSILLAADSAAAAAPLCEELFGCSRSSPLPPPPTPLQPRGRVNLYGPPLCVPGTRRLKELTNKAATLGYTDKVDYLQQYQNFPQHASTYRGRVMVMERITDSLPEKLKNKVCVYTSVQ